jgi:predicted alpha/beta-fold hydrolase
MLSSARSANALGLASLRLNLRGADGEEGDFYHGGLAADLHATVSSFGPLDFDRIFVLGFSLGGHVALRFATEVDQAQVAAIAAVCSPLDLSAGVDAIDRRLMTPYRTYALRRLRANYERTAGFGNVPRPPDELPQVRTLREWDSLTVVPRFGFDDTDDYYSNASVGPLMNRLCRPTLLVAAEDDPMIPPSAIRPALAPHDPVTLARFLTVRWLERGGHLGFPKGIDLGLAGPRGLESQVLLWLLHAAADSTGRFQVP